MKFLVHSAMDATTVVKNFGEPEYSYYFVLREFLPLLSSLGEVILISDPAQQVDHHYAAAQAADVDCVFLSFTPPHLTCRGLQCPTIPVFAWEFSSMPDEAWWPECPEHDWRLCLSQCAGAIVHSEYSRHAVQALMGDDYPVISIPAPLWDRLESLRSVPPSAHAQPLRIDIENGVVFDTRDPQLQPWLPTPEEIAQSVAESRALIPINERHGYRRTRPTFLAAMRRRWVRWYRQRSNVPRRWHPVLDRLSERWDPWQPGRRRLELSGVVFTSLFNPQDGRKNWVDMLTAYCDAFRHNPHATLVFKLGHNRYEAPIRDMLMTLSRLEAFQCRVILLHGFLSDESYLKLLRGTHYALNASYGEGQCLPLMEYLSCGKPAVAPQHSAMADYMDDQVGFPVNSWADATAWPHDPRVAYRTLRHQVDWVSLRDAFIDAYHCAHRQPERYRQLSSNAIERLRKHCSVGAATPALEGLLTHLLHKEPA